MRGVSLRPLKRIQQPMGDVLHAIKKSDPEFSGFGEAYFSTVYNGAVKGWKKHVRMTLNLVVPVGEIRFVLFDDRDDSETRGDYFDVTLSRENYQRLTVGPGLWMAFAGAGQGTNLLLNVASIEHDPEEALKCDLGEIPFNWT